MKNTATCRQEAEKLRESHPSYFKWPEISPLIGWRRYAGGCCVYCGKPLMTNPETMENACTDHLLPNKPEYTKIRWNEWNVVLSCRSCNERKGGYDCNSKLPAELRYTGGPDLTQQQHEAILELCREEVKNRRERRRIKLGKALDYWNGLAPD